MLPPSLIPNATKTSPRMDIVHFPHPALRFKSGDVTQIDDRFRAVVREMFDLMYAANGVGLAANQVGIPLRFFVFNPSGERELREEEHVFINPVIRNRKGSVVGEEGCLSLPSLFGDVRRAETIVIEAFNLEGEELRGTLEDLPARVFQHELDHLDGVLFIDRLSAEGRAALDARLGEMQAVWRSRQAAGEVPPDEEILRRLRATAAAGRLPPD